MRLHFVYLVVGGLQFSVLAITIATKWYDSKDSRIARVAMKAIVRF